MKSFKKSADRLISEKPSQIFLGIVFVFYILFNIQTPEFLAELIDTFFGKSIVILFAIFLFMKTNPVIGVLGLIVAYQIIKTSSITTGSYGMKHFLPSEESKINEMQSFNEETVLPQSMLKQSMCNCNGKCNCNAAVSKTNFGGVLEQEIVDKMIPIVVEESNDDISYEPVMDGQHNASVIDN